MVLLTQVSLYTQVSFPVIVPYCIILHFKQEQFSHVFFSIQVYEISDMINTLWNILKIGTKLVNCLLYNQKIVVSITFLIVSSLNLDILTTFRTVRLAEQSINWSDYGNCINVHCNSPVWYMWQATRISIDICQWFRHSNLKCQLHNLIFICNQGAVVVVIVW